MTQFTFGYVIKWRHFKCIQSNWNWIHWFIHSFDVIWLILEKKLHSFSANIFKHKSIKLLCKKKEDIITMMATSMCFWVRNIFEFSFVHNATAQQINYTIYLFVYFWFFSICLALSLKLHFWFGALSNCQAIRFRVCLCEYLPRAHFLFLALSQWLENKPTRQLTLWLNGRWLITYAAYIFR